MILKKQAVRKTGSRSPVPKIIDFRKSNRGLLNKFLTDYRGFLVELEAEPLRAERIVAARTQGIIADLTEIDSELAVLRSETKYGWLRRLSAAAFESARFGAPVAAWSLLISPELLAGALGALLLAAGAKGASDLLTEREKNEALLLRGSSGYLWKAREGFSPRA